LLKKIVNFLVQKSLGQDIALALLLLRTIAETVETGNVTDLAQLVFTELPDTWRQPKGPTSESEFVDLVQAGQVFLQKVKAATQS
jgi:hypothetical protein